jgi:RES domain-containing protein
VPGPVLWRIARRTYALDRTGVGARSAGGRWNDVGTAVIYTGRGIAIAALEAFVHTAGVEPPDLVLVRVALPERHSSETQAPSDLPPGWDAVPPGPSSKRFGTRWARESRSLVLYVPSALVPEESNGVVNPNHPEFADVTLAIERPFHYDPRMFGARTPPRRARA